MTRRFQVIGALIVLTGLLAAAPAGAQDAQAFVAQLGNQAIQVLGPSVSPAQRVARFRQLFRDDFDVPGLGQFVLGRYWRTATPEEQQEFLRLFQEYIVQAYAARLGEYGGEPFRVTGSRPSGDETVVTSLIERANAGRVQVDWYLINRGGAPKITDVYVGGVSMKVTQRDEFASVIQRNGGEIDALLKLLREKAGATQARG
jgi:phospholipid transport system substrate-binding protein